MFKSCCARSNKKISKSKSKSEKMDSMIGSESKESKENLKDGNSDATKRDESKLENIEFTPNAIQNPAEVAKEEIVSDIDSASIAQENLEKLEKNKVAFEDASEVEDAIDMVLNKRGLSKKRYSVDYKRSRLDFKRFSVDCRRDSATLEELARLEEELARTNIDVRPGGRRKSTGILKSTASSSNDMSEQCSRQEPVSDDDEVFEDNAFTGETGSKEPPATPVGRDELALRRHRFFSDLVCAARAAVEHRVRFDPLGPMVADPGEIKLY